MKVKFICLFVFSALLFACSEKDYYEPKDPDNEKGVADLVVPGDFDWSMTADVSCAFDVSATTAVEVYTDAKCDDNSLIAECTLSPGQEALPLVLSSHITTLYIKANGVTAPVEIKDGVASFVGTDSRSTRALEGESEDGYIYFPSKKGWATVMFEDYFPVKGDYDFNDFVANYRYVARLSVNGKEPEKYHVENIAFDVKVRALGGLYAYEPYINITGTNSGISSFEAEGASLESSGKGNDDIIVRLNEYTLKPGGVKFLNTDPDEVKVPASELRSVKFAIEFNGNGTKQDIMKIDFYLKGIGYEGKEYEIHQRGFGAIDKALYPNTGLGDVLYTTTDNLVWGITVPADIAHAIETENFLNAYPNFGKWAESGGTEYTDWYKNPVSKYLFPME